MSVEYWLVDTESGHAQGCHLSLEDALEAAEFEVEGHAIETLSLLAIRSQKREPQSDRGPEPKQRLFVRFELGLTEKS